MLLLMAGGMAVGCRSAGQHRREADKAADEIITQKQIEALGHTEPFTIERPEDTLRRRLILGQNLPYAGPASLGVTALEPIKHWPKDDYLEQTKGTSDPMFPNINGNVLKLTLVDALQVAARNSRDYQTRKENIFIDALALDLQRDFFRFRFSGGADATLSTDLSNGHPVTGVAVSPDAGVSKQFQNGAVISNRLTLDLVKLLSLDESAAMGILGDATLSVPLMRGSGKWIVGEPLTQAERNVIYDLLEFEQYKRQFAVSIASQYLRVLQQYDQVANAKDSLDRAVADALRSRRLAQAGELPPNQLDQAIQQELSFRERWISAQQSFGDSINAFKIQLGLPPDALVELDREELQRLRQLTAPILERSSEVARRLAPTTKPAGDPYPIEPQTQPTTQPLVDRILLEGYSTQGAGPLEMSNEQAVLLALEHRPDLQVSLGEVYDAQRKVVVAADALRAGLNATASATAGQRRSIGADEDADLRPERGRYAGGLSLDLPLERTAERNAYRQSLINLQRATRSVQETEDQIKLAVQTDLGALRAAREGLKTQVMALAVAERRVKGNALMLQAGLVQVRDVVESQSALINAQNALTAALVSYRVAELQVQRDLGVLDVNHEGLWREYNPAVEKRP